MSRLPLRSDERLLSGCEHPDDAGVYILDAKTVLVQTVDFFTPVVDDLFAFGRIAAANALSDIYAMGAIPITALNILAYPATEMEVADVARILEGGLDALKEADCLLLGGHSVDDEELKYGLAVTGIGRPDALWMLKGAKEGDVVILTKPIGTGVVTTAIKGGVADAQSTEEAVKSMSRLNRCASETARNFEVHACTDITGFGLAGHIINVAKESDVTVRLETSSVPLIEGALDLCRTGLAPGGLFRNRDHYSCSVRVESGLDTALVDLMFDPQTSGGLALFVPAEHSDELLEELQSKGEVAIRIGEVLEKEEFALILS